MIVNWNTRDLVLECLDSLPAASEEVSYEVIVVDNASCDGSSAALAERADVRLLQNAENLGFAAAVNQAYRESSGDLIFLLNSDVGLTPGSLTTLTRFLSEHREAMGVAPLYVNPDGTPQPFHFRLPTFTMTLANGSSTVRRLLPGSERRLRKYKMLDDDFSRPRPVPQPSASCLLLRRSCLPADHILDERYPIFFNDVQLARSLADQGFILWVTPDAIVVHEAHASTQKLASGSRKRQYLASVVRMLSETEPLAKVWLYRSVVYGQNAVLSLTHPERALSRSELRLALAGDPGPLQTQPSEPSEV